MDLFNKHSRRRGRSQPAHLLNLDTLWIMRSRSQGRWQLPHEQVVVRNIYSDPRRFLPDGSAPCIPDSTGKHAYRDQAIAPWFPWLRANGLHFRRRRQSFPSPDLRDSLPAACPHSSPAIRIHEGTASRGPVGHGDPGNGEVGKDCYVGRASCRLPSTRTIASRGKAWWSVSGRALRSASCLSNPTHHARRRPSRWPSRSPANWA